MSQKVIVCDDEAHILYAVAFKLKAAGFEVHQATNGIEAYELACKVAPDIIISDLQMPKADGFELCRLLRENPATEQIPIILLTAKAMELEEAEVKGKYRISAVHMKPFSPRNLVQAVQQTLAEASDQSKELTEVS